MKILITGASGQLGRELMEILESDHNKQIVGVSRQEMDVADEAQTRAVIDQVRPDIIIHCAAYTAVDQAETDVDRAYQVNAFGARNVAVASEAIGARMCYISTDYVFDGNSRIPYREFDTTNPISVYGKSKQAGEQLVQSLCSRYFIVRTSWLYGWHGNNFVNTMLRLAETNQQIRVVDDQTGSPTYAADLAEFLKKLIDTERYGIYHATNTGSCTWYEFARTLFELSGISVQLEPCSTEQFPRPAPRPKYSVLDHMAIRANRFNELRSWKEGLQDYLDTRKGRNE